MKKLSKTLIVIAVLAAIVFAASCSRYVEAKPKLIVGLRDVMAIDYDPDKNVIYYIGSEDRLNFEDNTQFIKSYNLNTNQHTAIAENFPYLTKPWIGIGKSNELFILDNGRNPFHDSLKDPNKRQILVYKDGIIIDSYNL